jgi:hypothetical protein
VGVLRTFVKQKKLEEQKEKKAAAAKANKGAG